MQLTWEGVRYEDRGPEGRRYVVKWQDGALRGDPEIVSWLRRRTEGEVGRYDRLAWLTPTGPAVEPDLTDPYVVGALVNEFLWCPTGSGDELPVNPRTWLPPGAIA